MPERKPRSIYWLEILHKLDFETFKSVVLDLMELYRDGKLRLLFIGERLNWKNCQRLWTIYFKIKIRERAEIV